MNDAVRKIIVSRIAELDLTPNSVSVMAGLDRSVLRKYLANKVQEMKDSNLRAIAKVLMLDPNHLREGVAVAAEGGREPHLVPTGAYSVPIVAEVEEGAFRRLDWFEQADLGVVHNTWDPHFPIEEQAAYLVKGPGMDLAGIHDGDKLICVDPWASGVEIGTGDYVVVETFGEGGQTRELVLRELVRQRDHFELVPRSADSRITVIRLSVRHDLRRGNPHIIGVVTSVIRRRPVRFVDQLVSGTTPPRSRRRNGNTAPLPLDDESVAATA